MYRPEAEKIAKAFGLKNEDEEKNYTKIVKFYNKNLELLGNCFIIILFGVIKIVDNEYNNRQGR